LIIDDFVALGGAHDGTRMTQMLRQRGFSRILLASLKLKKDQRSKILVIRVPLKRIVALGFAYYETQMTQLLRQLGFSRIYKCLNSIHSFKYINCIF
jgi:hypothetical protein